MQYAFDSPPFFNLQVSPMRGRLSFSPDFLGDNLSVVCFIQKVFVPDKYLMHLEVLTYCIL
jgi:hypothetical protein